MVGNRGKRKLTASMREVGVMEHVERAGSRLSSGWQQPGRAGRPWRPVRAAGIAAGLLLAERLLVGEVGSPRTLAETLRDLGEPWLTRSPRRSL
jgi:hypothetical protein